MQNRKTNTKHKTENKNKTIVVEQKYNENIFLKGEQAAKISKQVAQKNN